MYHQPLVRAACAVAFSLVRLSGRCLACRFKRISIHVYQCIPVASKACFGHVELRDNMFIMLPHLHFENWLAGSECLSQIGIAIQRCCHPTGEETSSTDWIVSRRNGSFARWDMFSGTVGRDEKNARLPWPFCWRNSTNLDWEIRHGLVVMFLLPRWCRHHEFERSRSRPTLVTCPF